MVCASAGITISKHYCGDQVMEVSLFSQADDCNDHKAPSKKAVCDVQDQGLCDDSEEGIDDCCSDEIDFKKTDLFKENTPDLQLSVAALPLKTVFGQNKLANIIFPLPNHPPPLIGPDIHILVQSFRC